jgi:hypothetical protein
VSGRDADKLEAAIAPYQAQRLQYSAQILSRMSLSI